jgi:hypothetical protein
MSEPRKINASAYICDSQYVIRSLRECDIEILRLWKNEHKEYFFLKTDITKAMQNEWFRAYNHRKNDHMFVILYKAQYIGCVGARYLDDCVDLYNIILGDKNYKGKHVMTNALWAVAKFSRILYKGKSIRVRVLKNNPAINWYNKIGFELISKAPDYVTMQLDYNKIGHQYSFTIEDLS